MKDTKGMIWALGIGAAVEVFGMVPLMCLPGITAIELANLVLVKLFAWAGYRSIDDFLHICSFGGDSDSSAWGLAFYSQLFWPPSIIVGYFIAFRNKLLQRQNSKWLTYFLALFLWAAAMALYYEHMQQKGLAHDISYLEAQVAKYRDNDPRCLKALLDVAELYNETSMYNLGNYSERLRPVLERAKRALENNEHSRGTDQSKLTDDMSQLAELYYSQSNYVEAESLFKRLLQRKEKALGPNDPSLEIILTELKDLYTMQHKYAEAAMMEARSKAIENEFMMKHVVR